jgi:hypothetical protein
MSDEQIRIERHELFDPAVDKALARERVGRERIVADAPAASPIRRLLFNSMFYLPLAAALGALLAWRLLEPHIRDNPTVGGEITLINAEPFDTARGVIALTVGPHEVLVDPERVELEPGERGEPAFTSVDQLKVGDRVEAVGWPSQRRLYAAAIRPTAIAEAHGGVEQTIWSLALLFPLTAALVAIGLLLAEGITTRNWIRMIERTLLGSFLATVFAVIAMFAIGLLLLLLSGGKHMFATPDSRIGFLVHVAMRSAVWSGIGAATGVGMNLVRSTRTQLRNSVVGGALGGALGGLVFDPIAKLGSSSPFATGSMSRGVGLIVVGLSIGVFMALVERLAREAWVRVRTGPLAGKSFILYKTPSIIGNAPQSDIYLYKDAEIDPSHAAVHRVGTIYELEDLGTRMGTSINGNKIRRRRLASGDQIVIGSTILDFEERQTRTPAA